MQLERLRTSRKSFKANEYKILKNLNCKVIEKQDKHTYILLDKYLFTSQNVNSDKSIIGIKRN